MLTNAHCHPQFLDEDVLKSTLSSWQGYPVLASCTHFDDVHPLLEMNTVYPHVLPTIGWHPWYIPTNVTQKDIASTMASFQVTLLQHNVPIGEVGLDWHPKWKATRHAQIEVFERFMTIAEELNRPVVVHCVRAHHEILRLLKRHPKTTLYLHDYRGNSAISAQYLRYNTYFGLSILHWSTRTNELIKNIPVDRLLIETDECVSSNVVSAQVLNRSISEALVVRCRYNLFQFIQGTSGDFSQQFEFCM